MFVWIIPGILGKAGHHDELPEGVERLIVAAEYDDFIKLKDEDIEQGDEFATAVAITLQRLALLQPTAVTCQGGLSRSVTVACLAAALWTGKSFWHYARPLKQQDSQVLSHQSLFPLATRLFPHQFSVRV